MTSVPDATSRRRTGRPRRDTRPVVGDPRDEILKAAGRLFGTLGVEQTSMACLAREVGLGQSSLYYYFQSREDVVAALVASANVVSLAIAEDIAPGPGSPAAKLHRFVCGDVAALSALPFDINEIHRVAARERDRFARYWRERARLERHLRSVLAAGIDVGQFRVVDPAVTAKTILANDEGTQNWLRVRQSARAQPRMVERTVADMVVGGLLAHGHHLADVWAELEGDDRPGENGDCDLVVVGAHLSGQPLNHELVDRGAVLVASVRTAPVYGLYALPTDPPKPGLVRRGTDGAAVEGERWRLAPAMFGSFVANVPAPLAIGTLELDDGERCMGFLCEEHATRGARDITSCGSWRAYIGNRTGPKS